MRSILDCSVKMNCEKIVMAIDISVRIVIINQLFEESQQALPWRPADTYRAVSGCRQVRGPGPPGAETEESEGAGQERGWAGHADGAAVQHGPPDTA